MTLKEIFQNIWEDGKPNYKTTRDRAKGAIVFAIPISFFFFLTVLLIQTYPIDPDGRRAYLNVLLGFAPAYLYGLGAYILVCCGAAYDYWQDRELSNE